MPTYYVVSRIE